MPPGFNPQVPPFAGLPLNPNQAHGSVPPHVQNAINSQLAAMGQHLAAQLQSATQGHQHMQQGQPHNHFHTQQWAFPQPSFQQIVAQQQQARAATGQHGLVQDPQNNGATGEQARRSPNSSQPLDSSDPPNAPPVVPENQGPSGGSFRMVIQSTSLSRPNSRVSQRPQSQNHTPQRSSTPAHASPNALSNLNISGTPTDRNGPHNPPLPPQAANALAMFQQRLSSIETSLAAGAAPPEGVFDHARAYLDNMAGQPNTLPPGLEAPLRARLNYLSAQAQNLRTNFNGVPPQMMANQHGTPRMPQGNYLQTTPFFQMASVQSGQQQMPAYTGHLPASLGSPGVGTSASPGQQPASQSPSQPSATPEIYLLSSPTGPHSLLIPSSGWYTTLSLIHI